MAAALRAENGVAHRAGATLDDLENLLGLEQHKLRAWLPAQQAANWNIERIPVWKVIAPGISPAFKAWVALHPCYNRSAAVHGEMDGAAGGADEDSRGPAMASELIERKIPEVVCSAYF